MGLSGDNPAVVQNGDVYGSYIHGVFDENGIAQAVVQALCSRKGIDFDEDADFDVHAYRESQYDLLADTVRDALDMKLVYDILEKGL